jgi:hypothetical protein
MFQNPSRYCIWTFNIHQCGGEQISGTLTLLQDPSGILCVFQLVSTHYSGSQQSFGTLPLLQDPSRRWGCLCYLPQQTERLASWSTEKLEAGKIVASVNIHQTPSKILSRIYKIIFKNKVNGNFLRITDALLCNWALSFQHHWHAHIVQFYHFITYCVHLKTLL